MEQKSNRIYAEMPPVRLFFHAAIPGVISMFAMSIYSIIEGISLQGLRSDPLHPLPG